MPGTDENALNDGTDRFVVVTEEVVTTSGEKPAPKANAEGDDNNQKPGVKQADNKTKDPESDKDKDPEDSPDTGGNQRRNRRIERRVGTLTKRAKEQAERAERAERALSEAQRKLAELASTAKPKAADFDSPREFEAALEKWNKEQGSYAKPAAPAAKSKPAVDPEFEEALDDVLGSFEDVDAKQYPDFKEVVHSEDLKITQPMVLAMAQTDDPAAIAYYLGKHPDEAKQIAEMKPVKVMKAIADLEAKLEAEAKESGKQDEPEPQKQTTKAPKPISPVKGSESSKRDMAEMSFNEFEEERNKQTGRRKSFW